MVSLLCTYVHVYVCVRAWVCMRVCICACARMCVFAVVATILNGMRVLTLLAHDSLGAHTVGVLMHTWGNEG